MGINITQDEVHAFNILEANAKYLNDEFQKTIAARDSYIKLLEYKYKATFDSSTGKLEPNKKEN